MSPARTRASYQPQFAFPPCPVGFEDLEFVHYFDAVSTPALGSTLAAGAESFDIPLFLEKDADFVARAIRIVGAAQFQFRDPTGTWLSEKPPAFPPLLSQSYQGQGLNLAPSGAFFQPSVVLEPEIVCTAGSAFMLYLYNPTGGPVAVAGFVSIEGVKRRRIDG